MFVKIGAVVGGLGLAGLFLASVGDLNMSTPMLILVIGLVLLLVGFFKGETKPNK